LIASIFEIISSSYLVFPAGKGLAFPCYRTFLPIQTKQSRLRDLSRTAQRLGLDGAVWIGYPARNDYVARVGSPASITMRSIIYASITHQD